MWNRVQGSRVKKPICSKIKNWIQVFITSTQFYAKWILNDRKFIFGLSISAILWILSTKKRKSQATLLFKDTFPNVNTRPFFFPPLEQAHSWSCMHMYIPVFCVNTKVYGDAYKSRIQFWLDFEEKTIR